MLEESRSQADLVTGEALLEKGLTVPYKGGQQHGGMHTALELPSSKVECSKLGPTSLVLWTQLRHLDLGPAGRLGFQSPVMNMKELPGILSRTPRGHS